MTGLTDAIGFFAAFCTTLSFLPQVVKIVQTRDTQSLSLMMYVIFTLGVATWLVYGILREDPAVIVANVVTLVLSLIILGLKIYNDCFAKPGL